MKLLVQIVSFLSVLVVLLFSLLIVGIMINDARLNGDEEPFFEKEQRDLRDNYQCIPSSDFSTRKPTLRFFPDVITYVGRKVRMENEFMRNRFFRLNKPAAELRSTQFFYSGSFTNWDESDSISGALLTINLFRTILTKISVHDTSSTDQLKEGSCPEASKTARTADGTCNDLGSPRMGAAGTRFGRNVPNDAAFPDETNRMKPNPRKISTALLARGDREALTADLINILGVSWVQFMTHDWFAHSNDLSLENVMTVPLPEDDELRERGIEHLNVMRTAPDPTRTSKDKDRAPTFQNQVTHWWDGSQIYGSDQATQDRLRSGVDGKLILTDKNQLLPERDGRSDSGFTQNWWIGLELMHTLFALEHNAVCDMLKSKNPNWDNQKVFDVARLINSAVTAKIHTVEWSPAISPNPYLEVAMHANWNGVKDLLNVPIPTFILNLSPGLSSFVDGLKGNTRNMAGHPYALTEDFVAIYRFHQLLPDEMAFKTSTGDISVPTGQTRGAKARELLAEHGMHNLLHSLGSQPATAFVLHNYPNFLRDLETPHGTIDLGTIDILRDRERGIPRYNEFRRFIALKPVTSFVDLTGGDDTLAREIEEVYSNNLELVDLQVGMAAEGVRPECFGLGETAFQIFIIISSSRIQKDRFFTDDYRPEIYTPEGIDWVENSTMKGVLLRHFPELQNTGLADVGNAFKPW